MKSERVASSWLASLCCNDMNKNTVFKVSLTLKQHESENTLVHNKQDWLCIKVCGSGINNNKKQPLITKKKNKSTKYEIPSLNYVRKTSKSNYHQQKQKLIHTFK